MVQRINIYITIFVKDKGWIQWHVPVIPANWEVEDRVASLRPA